MAFPAIADKAFAGTPEPTEHGAQRINVGAWSNNMATALLGRHVAGSAENHAMGCAGFRRPRPGRHSAFFCRNIVIQELGHAPIHDQHFPEWSHHDVLRLQVTMKYVMSVCE
jgi:hypothetical protein